MFSVWSVDVLSSDHRNLDRIRRNIFSCLKARNLCGNLLLDVASQEIYPITWELKSLNKNPKQNALEYLASGKGFLGDRIGDARNLK